MPYIMDPNFETIILLNLCPWGKEEKKELIEEIDRLGVDGQEFYSRNFRLAEQFYSTFEKHKVNSPGVALLKSYDDTIIVICASIFRKNPEWIHNADAISDSAARSFLDQIILNENDAQNADIFEAIDNLEVDDKIKWQLTLLRQKAGRQFGLIAEAVRENLQAFEKAYIKYKSEIDLLIRQFEQDLTQQRKSGHLMKLPKQLDPKASVNVTMALPAAMIVIEDSWYCGLIAYKLLGADDTLSKDELIVGAKAISDKSKIEILLSLKESSRYNLEIADKVGLTPATVSHHMSALLISGFVEVEKREGKVYYKLAEDGINRFLIGAKHLLLGPID